MRGRFAGEIPSVKLGERGVDVVVVEDRDGGGLTAGVDLDDLKNIDLEGVGLLGLPRRVDKHEREAFAAGRYERRGRVREPDVHRRPQIADRDLPTMPDSGVGTAPARGLC